MGSSWGLSSLSVGNIRYAGIIDVATEGCVGPGPIIMQDLDLLLVVCVALVWSHMDMLSDTWKMVSAL